MESPSFAVPVQIGVSESLWTCVCSVFTQPDDSRGVTKTHSRNHFCGVSERSASKSFHYLFRDGGAHYSMAVLLPADTDLTATAFSSFLSDTSVNNLLFFLSDSIGSKIKASKLQHVITVKLSCERVKKDVAKLKEQSQHKKKRRVWK